MVDYEKEYEKYEDTPNNIDYGSWYEYDNFQDFLDGKNAMDLTEGEDPDYFLIYALNEDLSYLDDSRDEEAINREEYVCALIEEKILEKEALEEFLKLNSDYEMDYESIESDFSKNGDDIGHIIEEYLMEEENFNLKVLENEAKEAELKHMIDHRKSLKKHNEESYNYDVMEYIDFNDYEDMLDNLENYNGAYDDFKDDYRIEEKYYEHIEALEELGTKIRHSKKEINDYLEFNEVSDYYDNPYDDN